MPVEKQILALGGGGLLAEKNLPLAQYALALTKVPRPKICFIGTASGDQDSLTVEFYRRFTELDCEPTHLDLFRRSARDLTAFLKAQNLIYVGGGNTANMLAIWRLHGLDTALLAAYSEGTVLSGTSAGSICWFNCGLTDSFGQELTRLNCLGFLPGSNCPHFDSDLARRPAYHKLISGGMPPGYAAEDDVALHFINGALYRTVSTRKDAKAYRVQLSDTGVKEVVIDPELLEERLP